MTKDGRTVGRPDGQPEPVDLLAIAAHRDDVELTCGGTLAKAVQAGHRVGIIDLTQGEMGTRGDAATRAAEAAKAAATLGVTLRLNAGMRDAHLENNEPSRKKIVELIRQVKPRVVILPFPVGRHPDHRIASELGRDACYLAGLAKYEPGKGGEAHRPFKLLYALAYREDPVKPTFVVDISEVFETKMQAIRCYGSQFDGAKAAGEIHPTGQDLYELIRVQSAHYGSLIRRRYGEPFYTAETQEVDDVLKLGVQSI
ncbi:MAG TPA: bacillithiol biosynthesis deacetylase BshB1 [Gemmatimonadales bacterium]|jgi:bacillithiol biosynthesis deacetylase BshB1|nr:bacillithiol biosynthesis deacetylase BshB1 [Gemmatimonadales bacterium]